MLCFYMGEIKKSEIRTKISLWLVTMVYKSVLVQKKLLFMGQESGNQERFGADLYAHLTHRIFHMHKAELYRKLMFLLNVSNEIRKSIQYALNKS